MLQSVNILAEREPSVTFADRGVLLAVELNMKLRHVQRVRTVRAQHAYLADRDRGDPDFHCDEPACSIGRN